MEIRISGSRNAKKALMDAANGLGKLKTIKHTNNYLNNDNREIHPKTDFVFEEEEEVSVFGEFLNGYKGVGPNCLYESMVQLGVDEERAEELVYNTDSDFTLKL